MAAKHQHKKVSGVYRRLLRYVYSYWQIMALGLLATVLFSGVDAGATYAIKPLINKGFIEKNSEFIAWVPLVIVLTFITRGVANFVSNYCMAWVARSVVMVLRREMFQQLLRLPASFYDEISSGKIISKLLYDVEQVSELSMVAITTFVQSLCIVIGLLVVMLVISWRLTLLFCITAPFIIFIVRLTNKRVRRVSLATQKVMGRVTEVAEESVKAYREVRIYDGQSYATDKFQQATHENRAFDMKVVATRSYSVSGVQIIAACGVGFVVNLAINPGFSTVLSAGGFASMIAAMLALLKPLKNLTRVNADIQRGLAGAESIFQLLDEVPETDSGAKQLAVCRGAISYQNVNFAYGQQSKTVLNNINLQIIPGQTIALVGRSGSGKSTLVSLLCRFYDIQSGVISIDGVDISQLSLAELRRQIAIVSQNVTLFNGTVASNIAFGHEDEVSLEAIEQAATAAHAMEFIDTLPQGLQTPIGENGVLLSGGQRQRIAIARALLKDAPILILDEATSALDTESERHIQAALTEVMKNRTTLIIAHRLSTIENADRIMVLEAGRIVERGSHHELLAQQGYYAKLQAMQFAVQPQAELIE